jgi:hypothetical protein
MRVQKEFDRIEVIDLASVHSETGCRFKSIIRDACLLSRRRLDLDVNTSRQAQFI